MFVESCKRLRIMKGSEAIGLGMYISIILSYNNVLHHFVHFYLLILTMEFFSMYSQHQEQWRNAKTEAKYISYIKVQYQSGAIRKDIYEASSTCGVLECC